MTRSLVECELDGDTLFGIAAQIWAAYLDVDGSRPLVRVADEGRTEVIASVSVTGGWDGHVLVGCSVRAATNIAASMLALEPAEVSPADALDAVGELVNIVGGNVKSMLPESSALSLPVTAFAESHPRYPGTWQISGVTGQWQGEPLTITVLQVDLR